MPNIFDQIHARETSAPPPAGAPDTAQAPAQASGNIFDRIHAERTASAPPAATAAAATPTDDPDHAGFWYSFYNETAGPIVEMIHDSINRGDLGEKAASDILDAFSSQLKTFAAHPDIRNLPLIGPGATATAARMQQQYNAGNYKGMIGTAAGFAGALVAPEAHAAIVEKLPAAAQAAARWGEAAGAGAKAGAEAAAPDLAAAAKKGAYSVILDRFVPDPVRGLVHLGEGAVSVGQAARGVYRGAKAARAAYQDVRAAQAAADAATAAEEATAAAERARDPRVPIWQKAYADAEAARAAEEAAPAAEPPAAAAPPTDFEAAPDARDSLTPEMQQRADEVRAQTHAPGAAPAEPEPAGADVSIGAPEAEAQVPALTPAQRLRDAIDQHAAYLRMQADDVTWGNRARQAEQYASWFVKNKLEVTPENLQRAANELEPRAISKRTGLPLGPSEVPGEETADMIADRVDWHNARQQAATGPHGPILENFQHDAQGAIDELRRRQSGDAIGALYHPEIGDIDLIWGKAGNPERDFSGGYGLAHIDAKHPGIAEQLADILPGLQKGEILRGNRQLLSGKNHQAVVRLDWNEQAKRWLLTAYEGKAPGSEELLRGSERASVEGPTTPSRGVSPASSVNQAAPAADDYAAQLQASIEAVNSKRGKQASAKAGHVESEVSGSTPEPGAGLDTGRTGGRPPLPAPGTTGAGTQGERTAVDVPGEQRAYPAQYSVRELSDIQPSHLGETFQPNPDYQFENDRLYDDPRNQRKIVDWSTKAGFKPRNLVNTAPTSELGPPVVDPAGNVLGGNGRTMILQRVYKSNPEGAAAYRAELDRTAAHYGIDPASYADMKQPVLVREIDPEILKDEDAARRAITDFNKVGTAALTPAERAIADAKGVSQKTLDDIAARMDRLGPDATLAQTIEGRQGIEVIGNLERDGVISPQERAELATETKLTKSGKERISGLMLGRWFQDAKQMDALPDSLRNKLERITAPLARAESAHGYSLQPTIKAALDLLEDSEAHGSATIDDYINQRGLFGDREFSPEAIAFAKALKSTNPVELTHAARRYAERAKYAEEYQGPGMFGDIPAPLPPAEAFSDSFSHLTK